MNRWVAAMLKTFLTLPIAFVLLTVSIRITRNDEHLRFDNGPVRGY